MTTQMLTIVFTDMVDSTGVSARLRPDEADALRREHFTALREALGQHGGDEVKSLGDGLMAIFTSPSAALSATVSMQQAIDRKNRAGGEPMGLRIGVSAGEVTVEDADVFGEPVVEAARLCALAEGGQILLATLARAMAGRRVDFSFQSVG